MIRQFSKRTNAGPAQLIDKAYGMSAFYDLADEELRTLIEWLIGDRKHDVRYDLMGYPSECGTRYGLRQGRPTTGLIPREAGPTRRVAGGRGFFLLAIGFTTSDL